MVRTGVDFGFGPAFYRPDLLVHTAEGTDETVLAQVALPGPLRSQQAGLWRAPGVAVRLLPVGGSPPQRGAGRKRQHVVAAECASAACLWIHLQRPRPPFHARDSCRHHKASELTSTSWTSHGTVLLTVRGLEMGPCFASNQRTRDRVLSERLLTIDWQQRDLPEAGHAEPGAWLLIAASTAADVVAANWPTP